MGERRAGQKEIGWANLQPGRGDTEHPRRRFVRVSDTFGQSGAARGEKDDRRSGRIGRWRGCHWGFGAYKVLVTRKCSLGCSDGDLTQRKPSSQGAGCEIGNSFCMNKESAGFADIQSMINFRSRITIVERSRHQAGFETREIVHDEVRAVRHERCDAVAGLESEPEQASGQTVAPFIKFTPAPPHVR